VRPHVFGALRLLVLPTLALAAVAAFLPGRIEIAARVYALIACAVVLAFVLRALRRAYPLSAPLTNAAHTSPAGTRPPTLAQLENEVALGIAGTFDLHHRLRPHLRSLTADLLETRRRTSLDRDPEAARAILGEETWDLVRPGRPAPEDRLARGLSVPELRSVLESLERV
jgi:hypothetical protein